MIYSIEYFPISFYDLEMVPFVWLGCIPDGIAVFAGLAVLEAQLLKRFCEDVFAGHVGLDVV